MPASGGGPEHLIHEQFPAHSSVHSRAASFRKFYAIGCLDRTLTFRSRSHAGQPLCRCPGRDYPLQTHPSTQEASRQCHGGGHICEPRASRCLRSKLWRRLPARALWSEQRTLCRRNGSQRSGSEYEYSPVRQVLRSEVTGEEVCTEELVKGYEYGPNQFAVIEPAAIERVAVKTSDTIDLFH